MGSTVTIPNTAVKPIHAESTCLETHPGVGLDKWTDLPKATAFVGKEALGSFYQWMKSAYGFRKRT